jgi:hypothetical protein
MHELSVLCEEHAALGADQLGWKFRSSAHPNCLLARLEKFFPLVPISPAAHANTPQEGSGTAGRRVRREESLLFSSAVPFRGLGRRRTIDYN